MMTSYYPSGLFVKEDSPWKTLEEFVQHARKNPGAVRYAHTGQGAVNHLNALSLEREAGLTLTGIPTGGGGQALNMLLGGHVEAAQVAVPVVWPQVEAKQVRCLAYSLPQRSELYPGPPTYREKGYDFRFWISQGIAAPKGTPAEAVKKLHDAFAAAFNEKIFQQTMQTLRFPPYYLNTEDTVKYLAEMYQYYGQAVKKLGVTLKK
jgi:tripartite-type tricarboxylate transporter receptor subunit TctC